MFEDQQQFTNQNLSSPRSRYEKYHQATITRTQAVYGYLGADTTEFIAGMIEFLRYEFPVDRYTREETIFYQDKSKFLDHCLALPEKERGQKALMAIDAVVKQLFPDENEEQRRPYVGSFYFLFNHAIKNYPAENMFVGSKQPCTQITSLK